MFLVGNASSTTVSLVSQETPLLKRYVKLIVLLDATPAIYQNTTF